jgi:hypothetical protein
MEGERENSDVLIDPVNSKGRVPPCEVSDALVGSLTTSIRCANLPLTNAHIFDGLPCGKTSPGQRSTIADFPMLDA